MSISFTAGAYTIEFTPARGCDEPGSLHKFVLTDKFVQYSAENALNGIACDDWKEYFNFAEDSITCTKCIVYDAFELAMPIPFVKKTIRVTLEREAMTDVQMLRVEIRQLKAKLAAYKEENIRTTGRLTYVSMFLRLRAGVLYFDEEAFFKHKYANKRNLKLFYNSVCEHAGIAPFTEKNM